MKKMISTLAIGGMMVAGLASSSFAANLFESGSAMMQCSAACSSEYLQCVGSSQKLATAPTEAMSQIKANFDGASACGQAAAACQSSCK